MKLNQVLAIEKGTKTKIYSELTEVDKTLQKAQLLSGISRVYSPKDDDGEKLPAESTLVQVKTENVLDKLTDSLEELWNITATKELANCEAKADVKLDDGTVLIPGAPVSYLLFLDKQLTDIRTMISRLPILDPAYEWEWDANSEQYRTKEVQTHRTKKVPRVLVKYDATPEHPAQTDVFNEDVIVGYWSTTHLSGAIPVSKRSEMLERVDNVLKAVKIAKEEANSIDVQRAIVATEILNYIF